MQHVLLHAEMAMMKSYALNQPDGKGGANRFVAYMVPKETPREQPAHPSSRFPTFVASLLQLTHTHACAVAFLCFFHALQQCNRKGVSRLDVH